MQQNFNGSRVLWSRSSRHVYFRFPLVTSQKRHTFCASESSGMPFVQGLQIELYWIVLCECPLRSIETQMGVLIWKKSSFCASRCTLRRVTSGCRTTPLQGRVCTLHPVLGRKLWRSLRHRELLKYVCSESFLSQRNLVSVPHNRFIKIISVNFLNDLQLAVASQRAKMQPFLAARPFSNLCASVAIVVIIPEVGVHNSPWTKRYRH